MNYLYKYLILLLILLSSTKVYATIGPFNIGFLSFETVQSSTHIACGRVIKILSETDGTIIYGNKTVTGKWKAYEILIDYNIRGDNSDSSITLEIFKPVDYEIAVIFDRVNIGRRYLFCLVSNQLNSSYKLSRSIGASIQLSDSPQKSTGNVLVFEIEATLEDKSQATAIPILRSLIPLGITYDQVENILKKHSEIDNLNISAIALAVRVNYRDPDAILDILKQESQFSESQVREIAYAVRNWNDKNGLQHIIELTKSNNVLLRREAVYVIRKLGDKTEIPLLSTLMMDKDIDVSYNAVMGLSRITGSYQELAPSYPKFLKNKIEILRLWKQKLQALEK